MLGKRYPWHKYVQLSLTHHCVPSSEVNKCSTNTRDIDLTISEALLQDREEQLTKAFLKVSLAGDLSA